MSSCPAPACVARAARTSQPLCRLLLRVGDGRSSAQTASSSSCLCGKRGGASSGKETQSRHGIQHPHIQVCGPRSPSQELRDTCTPKFTAALLTAAETWKHPQTRGQRHRGPPCHGAPSVRPKGAPALGGSKDVPGRHRAEGSRSPWPGPEAPRTRQVGGRFPFLSRLHATLSRVTQLVVTATWLAGPARSSTGRGLPTGGRGCRDELSMNSGLRELQCAGETSSSMRRHQVGPQGALTPSQGVLTHPKGQEENFPSVGSEG